MESSSKIYNEAMLSDVDVLSTSIGVQMIDNYSKADPDKACEYMQKAFGNLSIEELSSIHENRQGLCRTLSRLCFNRSTFETAAYLLLRFSLSEQEEDLCIARRSLQQLFYPILGSTEADLRTRLAFIKGYYEDDENLGVLMSVIDSALTIQSVLFHDGTDQLDSRVMQPYRPKQEEVVEYICAVMGIVENLTESECEEIKSKAFTMMENHFVELCKYGLADVVLPVIEKACDIKQNRWDSLLDKLMLLRNEMTNPMTPRLNGRYESIIRRLTKDDFEFRFKRVEKELRTSSFKISADKLMEEQRVRYKVLGEEFCQKNYLSKELLANLYDSELLSTFPFGEVLAKNLTIEQKSLFVDYSIEILNQRKKFQNDILIDYASGLTEEEFETQFGKLKTLISKRVLYAVVARRSISFDNHYMDVLVEMVRNGEATTDCFIVFWSNFRFAYMQDEDIAQWMVRIRELPEGESTVLHILQSAINGIAFEKNTKVVQVALETVMGIEVDYSNIMGYYQYWNVVRLLLIKGCYPKLAKMINNVLLNYVKEQNGLFVNHYEISQTYRLLFAKYFEDVWMHLSEMLLSEGEDIWTYYRLKEILGSMIGGVHNEVGLLFEEDHTDALMEWCRKNPQKAPERLMEMVPVFTGQEGFSKILIMLLDEFGQNQSVLNALSHNLGCFSVYGSVNVLYEKQIKAIEPLKNHKYPEVQAWSKKMLQYLKKQMENENNCFS